MHILVIDDDSEIREMLRGLLASNGYTVTEAGNGEAGLQLFDNSSPDLVITDIVMPDREGISTIMELRKKNTRVPIIVMSGGRRFSLQYLKTAGHLGANQIMEKPLDLQRLLESIRELLPNAERTT